VLCANNDAWRLGRSLLGHRRPTPSGGSPARLKTCPIDDPNIDDGFTRLLTREGAAPFFADSTKPQRLAGRAPHQCRVATMRRKKWLTGF
jgi:hypothetical protein